MGRLFGTDGVRGIANEKLNAELAMRLGCAAAAVLSGNSRRRPVFVVGMDSRISSDMLAMACAAGLCSVGADVIMLGVVPTPAVAYLVGKYKADAGITISASHNPAEFNGIKMFGGEGLKLPDEIEERIENYALGEIAQPEPAKPESIGKVIYMGDQVVKDYVDHLTSTVSYSLDGLKIAVDCANGSASRTAERLFKSLGAECRMLYNCPDGFNINRGCGSTDMANLVRYVKEHGMDAGVAFDGDADRCLMVDENGQEIDGDVIMAICANDMKARGRLNKNTVVGTIMTNLGFIRFCEREGIRFIATKVGDRFVMEEMLLEEYSFGGEQSGHLIFRDFASTGDGELTAIQLLSLMRREGKKLSELAGVMTRYPQVMINVHVSQDAKLLFYTDPDVKQAVEDAKAELGKEGRIVARISGTEPLIRVMVEGRDDEQIRAVANRVADVVRERLG
ncbi:MAG: Phosphoglucosamine mutase [Firmicutes bacterium ADurb.Bin467]|nr:MAG: Phosphoglucosamine mutase [Firmicutes bacterium ADurb.Bin467]